MSNPNSQIPDETQNPNPQPEAEAEEEAAPPTPHPNPQSPKTLTLSDQNPQIQNQNLPDPDAANPNQDPKDGDTVMQDLTPPQSTDEPEPEDAPPLAVAPISSAPPRRVGSKRKKLGSRRRNAQEKQLRKKLKVLVETLKPIPFVPQKALDFESHKPLLQRLGLWDFVHVEFDAVIRGDLVAQLIASYAQSGRCSYVNDIRVPVSRADLGRALKLPKFPVKKTTAAAAAATAVAGAGAEEAVVSADLTESIAFIEDLVFNWMLLHDDMFVMPDDVMAYIKVIREGNFEKVDWVSLIWNMVERELKADTLVNCYYASHLQQLIKMKLGVLEEAPKAEEEAEAETEVKGEGEEAEVKGEGEEVGVKDEEEEEEEEDDDVREEVDGSGDVMKTVGVHEPEEPNVELSLGQDNLERVEVQKKQGEEEEQVGGDQIMDFDPVKEEEHNMWLLDQKNNAGEHFLRQCNTSVVKAMDCGEMKEDEGEEGQEHEEEEEEEDAAEQDQHDGGFHISPKCIPMEGMPSGTGSLIHSMDAGQLPFGSGIDLRDNHVGDFLSARDDDHMIPGSSLFGNGHKRDIGLDNQNPHHSLNGSNKRLRSDSPWNSKPVDFEMCWENMHHWMGKARLAYAAKEEACEESTRHQQLLLNELQKRDGVLDLVQKARVDECHRKQMEVYRLEKELFMMSSLVEGYRKALKETQKAFDEYRARFPQADEPLYRDVPGSGGLVLTAKEIEKERLRKEEEEKMKMREYEKKFRDIERAWFDKLEGYVSKIQSLDVMLLAIGDQVKDLNEVIAKRKVSDSSGCAKASEEQTA
ncbi:hypothetical protein RIF29_31319 [Crotalaria pallida]|uniref:Uncharacterized protein n=1 Tax=Crotalaria pallida TaxID=3830 RepID=A0AAN9HYR2_CROPI